MYLFLATVRNKIYILKYFKSDEQYVYGTLTSEIPSTPALKVYKIPSHFVSHFFLDDKPTNPIEKKLSPGSPVKAGNSNKAGSPIKKLSPEKKHLEECCICFEENVSPSKTTKCKHNICQSCTNQLEKLECPYCRTPLVTGGYITDSVTMKINAKMKNDKIVTELVNYLMAQHISHFNERNMKYDARDYAYAFRYILDQNPDLTEREALAGYLFFVRESIFFQEEYRPEDFIIRVAPKVFANIYNS